MCALCNIYCPCPVDEWLERQAEEHVCPRCAGSKPARAICHDMPEFMKKRVSYLYEQP